MLTGEKDKNYLPFPDPYDFVIKRLVGLEGDVIENSDFSPNQPVVIAKGNCWVEGDNRKNSIDSNSAYGPISKGLIFGKVNLLSFSPFVNLTQSLNYF